MQAQLPSLARSEGSSWPAATPGCASKYWPLSPTPALPAPAACPWWRSTPTTSTL